MSDSVDSGTKPCCALAAGPKKDCCVDKKCCKEGKQGECCDEKKKDCCKEGATCCKSVEPDCCSDKEKCKCNPENCPCSK
ncbi:metallothionein-1-like [Limulus polyphemus]|uniref:Metallothionein-1-like n=1 Tax=Limulus polyphemus TaxID=6850 RepID=A0ABM1B3H5_LIMPO|nr:metallothionein-1-like [Limulus polyphemus]